MQIGIIPVFHLRKLRHREGKWFTGSLTAMCCNAAPSRHHNDITARRVPKRFMGTWVQGRVKGSLNWAWRAESWAGWLCAFRFCTMELQTPASLSPAPPRLLLFFPLSMLSPRSFHYHQLWTRCLLAAFSTCPSYSLPSSKTSSQDWALPRKLCSSTPHLPQFSIPLASSWAPLHLHTLQSSCSHRDMLLALSTGQPSNLHSHQSSLSLCSKPIFLSLFF